jgi:nicotinamidase-related amidase
MNTALILIDIQNEYFEGGKNPLVGPDAAVQQARRLLDVFRAGGRPRVHIQHIAATKPGAVTFQAGTPGVEIHPLLQPQLSAAEVVFQKHYPNSFRETPLLEHLRALGIERLVIAGMMTHMCVEATTRAAYDFGFECWVAQDACATKALTFEGHTIPAEHVHFAFLAALTGRYAKVACVDEIVAWVQAL